MKLRLSLLSILFILFATDLFACTTVIVTAEGSQSGRPMIWKQRDHHERDNVVRHFKGARFNFTAIVDVRGHKHASAWGGCNDIGFGIANSNSVNLSNPPGQNSHNGHLMFEALSRCETVDEFEDLAKAMIDTSHFATNVAVIDARGGAAYFEIGDRTITRYDVMGTWDVRTNFSLSGPADASGGLTRYNTTVDFMTSHKGKFVPEDFIDGLGRSFYNSMTQTDAIKDSKNGISMENDCIARSQTISSFVIEGVSRKDALSSSVMWCAIGYTPACYAVPVWVAARDDIPVTVGGENGRRAIAERLATKVKELAYTFPRDNNNRYMRVGLIAKSRDLVRRYEKTEFKEGRSLDKKFRRKGPIVKEVLNLNQRIEKRFQMFRKEMDEVITKAQNES